MHLEYKPIGTIHSPHRDPVGVPIQPTGARGIRGSIEMLPEYTGGLKDLDGFSHIILLYHLHRSREYKLHVIPFLDKVKRGVFATRAPHRPNPIGLSIVQLLSIEGSTIHVEGVDILDGTPLLDIKPYLPALNPSGNIRTGWVEKNSEGFHWKRADSRFSGENGTKD